jgi:hypothetical protein
MKIGEFRNLRDDLNFNLSLISGLTIASFISVIDFIFYVLKKEPLYYLYLCSTIILIILSVFAWKNYLRVREKLTKKDLIIR